jgi:hypothetical protein
MATDEIIHICLGCGQKLRVPAAKVGKPGRCPRCGRGFGGVARPTRRLFNKWAVRAGAAGGLAAAGAGYYAYDRLWVPLPDFPPGTNAGLLGRRIFPADDPWNQDVSGLPVDPASDSLVAVLGADLPLRPDFGRSRRGRLAGIPYLVVPGGLPAVPAVFQYADESDPGPYPVPLYAPVEGGPASTGDRHVLVVDWEAWKLYELLGATPTGGLWEALSGAVFDLTAGTTRPAGWTSADAAGLPILPGLVRWDEVYERGEIAHALRFTTPHTRKAYVHPARHYASFNRDPLLPPMGLRLRLRPEFDLTPYPADAQVVLRALQRHGMFLADNGMPWGLTGTADPRWPRSLVNALKGVRGRDFEAVELGKLVTG